LPHLIVRIEGFFLRLGPLGLFLMAIEDSAAVALLPELLMIELTIHNPSGLFWYVSITVAGAILGSLIPFLIARKLGREWVQRKMPPRQFTRIHAWFEHNEMMAVTVPSILPPPVPFKLFVLVAGLFEMTWLHFVAAMAVGRYIRYLLEAWLGLIFGPEVLRYGLHHPLFLLLAAILLALGAYFYGRRKARRLAEPGGRTMADTSSTSGRR
jgi:uncharacterized membrane protein YdjX (TVP38/TMEM64 family)